MSNADYIRGFNNGLVAGLTQKPLVFGLGLPNNRSAVRFIITTPIDNDTYQVTFSRNGYSSGTLPDGFNGSINWGDGTVEPYTTWSQSHVYATAGSYVITLESNLTYWYLMRNPPTDGMRIKSISMPSNIKFMSPGGVFAKMRNLIDVSLPEGLTRCDFTSSGGENFGVFSECTALQTVTIPSTLNYAPCCFSKCTALRVVNLTNGLVNVSGYMFSGCTNLTSITIPNSVTSIDNGAFRNSGLNEINYNGTTAQWRSITIGIFAISSGVVVHCTDGDITI